VSYIGDSFGGDMGDSAESLGDSASGWMESAKSFFEDLGDD